jgi:hypothetical protein
MKYFEKLFSYFSSSSFNYILQKKLNKLIFRIKHKKSNYKKKFIKQTY